jgi:hypothetical protein
MLNKRKVIYFLVAVVAALLLINVLLSLIQTGNQNQNTDEISSSEIEKSFLSSLDNFGIKENWINKQKLKKKLSDSISYIYQIKIPLGLTIPQILKDMSEEFANKPAILNSEEKKIGGITRLEIKSRNSIKLISEFKYDPILEREFSQTGFILINYNESSEKEIDDIFKVLLPFGVLLPLESNSQIIAENVKNNKKEYFLELNDDCDDSGLELNDDLELEELTKNCNKIISNFNSPKYFFITKKESGFNFSTIDFISDKFENKGRKILKLENYTKLQSESISDLKSLYNFHLVNLKAGGDKIFLITVTDWLLIQNEISNYIKKGNKVVFPSQLLN